MAEVSWAAIGIGYFATCSECGTLGGMYMSPAEALRAARVHKEETH